MTPNNQIIPITEDDQGEGYMNVLNLDDIQDRLQKLLPPGLLEEGGEGAAPPEPEPDPAEGFKQ